jgi:hypothetical protein
VELNPAILASILGTDARSIEAAIAYLCAPDPRSRTKDHDGKRLIREGEFQYFMPTHEKYRAIRNDDDRREYFRVKKAEQRARDAVKGEVSKCVSKTVLGHSNKSTHTEAEAEAEAKAKSKIDVGQNRPAAAVPTSQDDAAWLQGLKADPAYKGIGVDREHAKMCQWCAVNGKQPTRRRFVNWLNRCDRPITGQAAAPANSTF